MMDAIVQLVRNSLCCLSDLGLFTDSWLYDAKLIARYYDFPEPLNKTTPLHVMISIAQSYVVCTGVPSAIMLMWKNYGKMKRIYRLLDCVGTWEVSGRQSKGGGAGDGGSASIDVDRLIHASLIKEAKMALRSIFVGFNLFFICLAFVWLTANSWHITEAGWIGGLPALMHALTVMNVCLVPLLYFMYKDAKEKFLKASRMRLLMVKLETGTASSADIGLTTVEALTGWIPFWESGEGLLKRVDKDFEAKQLATEKMRLLKQLDEIVGKSAEKKDESVVTRQQDMALHLKAVAFSTRLEGFLEFAYFVMNSIAGYGYSVCVIVYYWPDELQQPDWLRLVLLNLSNSDSDWLGNFAGDLMWTIEPIVTLTSPYFLSAIRSGNTKKKINKSKID